MTRSSQTRPYSDTINYTGFGGAAHTVRIWYWMMGTALRCDRSLRSLHHLFCPGSASSTPCLNGGASASGTYYMVVATSVELPDGRSYRFKYNSYG